MSMLRGFLILVVFFLFGEALRALFLLPVSGGVLGMILMTLSLMLRGRVSDDLASASQALISVLVLLIMPGVVGVFFLASQFSGQWLAVSVALLLGTFLSVLTTLLVMKTVLRQSLRRRSND
ncbi:CidA/LrgA family protein [Marinobacter xiaoshiensis]|uniref:CidA/LrgA family protein n=1 Tax=Marinobacter xiaoshiensis TaxID=3073652 RepID=A0ABU2HC96_9GAMM|nr:CidA/LrgA family protein [Marinobacter sp. F60267]MDS1308654.1 CidA/LrgA family protein [Marinobacter sp. F60267]